MDDDNEPDEEKEPSCRQLGNKKTRIVINESLNNNDNDNDNELSPESKTVKSTTFEFEESPKINIYRRPSSMMTPSIMINRNSFSLPYGDFGASTDEIDGNNNNNKVSSSNRGSVSNHVFLVPPSIGRRFSRQRGSSVSNISFDNASNISGSSMAFLPSSEDEEDEDAPCLLLSRLEKIPMKDFCAEIRGKLDIKKFLKEAILILDINGSCLEDIVENMLMAVLSTEIGSDGKVNLECLVEEAKKTLFIQTNYMNYTYQRLAKTIRGLSLSEVEGLMTDQSWLCTMCSLNNIHKRHVSIARLDNPVNLGRSSEGIYFIILVITPTKEKGTKSDIELGRTFATIFADVEFRQQLLYADTVDRFKEELQNHSGDLMEDQSMYRRRRSLKVQEMMNQAFHFEKTFPIGSGVISDLMKRIPHYKNDFRDGFVGKATIRKVVSATIFLYFACLLPSIAFGVLNYNNTEGQIDVCRVIISQAVGGLIFGIFGGQPLIILLTTAPLALYTKVIFSICEDYKIDFSAMYCLVGLINSLLLILYSLLDLSKLMRWSTRSSEEIFALFVSIAFIFDAVKDVYLDFSKHYFSCLNTVSNASSISTTDHNNQVTPDSNSSAALASNRTSEYTCEREVSILYLFLVVGTVWFAVQMFNITKTPFLNNAKREMLTDFALPVAVIVMTMIGAVLFKAVPIQRFTLSDRKINLEIPRFIKLPGLAYLGAIGLAFPLSLLIFMDQNIASAMVNSPANKLRKGSAYHWDLLVVAVINAILSAFGLPWVHGTLPHSPLHVKTLADIEERIEGGHHVHQTIVRVRETRITSIISHILIAVSLLMLPTVLIFIPVPILDGLFVYMAVTSLYGNQFFERILLLFTEQSAYPPSHYIRRVPQRKLHIFTGLQLGQLAGLCLLGFAPSPYLKMGFPLMLILHIIFRHQVVPKLFDDKYLNALDKPV